MNTGEILFLNRIEVQSLIGREQVFSLVEDAIKEYSYGNTINPVKLSLPVFPYHNGHINSMPSYMKKGDLAGVKVVSVFNNNPSKHDLPTTVGTIILHDAETGIPYAILDGTYITDLRTGAVSGIKAKYLARQDSHRLAIIGAGVQGYTSMEMILLARPDIDHVDVCDLSKKQRDIFMEKGKKQYPNICFEPCADHQVALIRNDIVLYATSASRPLLETGQVPEGVTVICVCELVTRKAVEMFDSWFVDHTECALDRYNDGGRQSAAASGTTWADLTPELVTGDLGDVMTRKIPGRVNSQQKILSGAVGMSIEDIIVARAAVDAATEKGIGKILAFQCL